MKNIRYLNPVPPPGYRCSSCQITGVKLWRNYGESTMEAKLLCATCAASNQSKSITDIDAEGKHTIVGVGCRTEHIGWYVPAIPLEDGHGFWGFISIPEIANKWWIALPTLGVKDQQNTSAAQQVSNPLS